jgi:hypothetical protein
MDLEFVLTLKSQGWLKWFCCPHCGSNFAISKSGRCNVCDEYLVLKRGKSIEFESDVLNDITDNKSNILMPWEVGSSFYYHMQWIQWDGPRLEIDIS